MKSKLGTERCMQMQNFEDRTFSKGSSLQGRIFNMNKQSLRKTGFFLKGKGNYMNRTSKMVTLFQEKLLRKKVDYQEEC